MSTTTSASRLASEALRLMNAGNLEAAKALLATAAGEPWADRPRPRAEPASLLQDELARAAARCMLGTDPLSVGFRFHDASHWLPICSMDRGQVEFAESARRLLPAGPPWGEYLTGPWLADLRAALTDRPESLKLARECMARTTWLSLGQVEAATEPGSAPQGYLPGRVRSGSRAGADESFHGALSTLLSLQVARRAVGERSTRRLLYWASTTGASQREVADWIGKPQTYVFRQLKAIEEDPSVMSLTPRELYEHYVAHEIDRASMLALLAAYPYRRGSFPEDEPYWGYVPGSLDDLTQLALEGRISNDELDVVLGGVEALATDDD